MPRHPEGCECGDNECDDPTRVVELVRHKREQQQNDTRKPLPPWKLGSSI